MRELCKRTPTRPPSVLLLAQALGRHGVQAQAAACLVRLTNVLEQKKGALCEELGKVSRVLTSRI